jgi:hypothetical protein
MPWSTHSSITPGQRWNAGLCLSWRANRFRPLGLWTTSTIAPFQ